MLTLQTVIGSEKPPSTGFKKNHKTSSWNGVDVSVECVETTPLSTVKSNTSASPHTTGATSSSIFLLTAHNCMFDLKKYIDLKAFHGYRALVIKGL